MTCSHRIPGTHCFSYLFLLCVQWLPVVQYLHVCMSFVIQARLIAFVLQNYMAIVLFIQTYSIYKYTDLELIIYCQWLLLTTVDLNFTCLPQAGDPNKSPVNMTSLIRVIIINKSLHTFKASFLSEESLALSDLKDDISCCSKSWYKIDWVIFQTTCTCIFEYSNQTNNSPV